MIVRSPPVFKKSINLYFPGPNTNKQEGSNGVINDMDADNITAIANGLGLTLS